MPVALNERERDLLVKIVKRTRRQIRAALHSYAECGPGTDHVPQLESAAANMARLMACLTDGKWYGAVPTQQLQEIFVYGQLASDLLRANKMNAQARDVITRVSPGRFKVVREITDGDKLVARKPILCNNPAYGLSKLDDWQSGLDLQRAARRVAS